MMSPQQLLFEIFGSLPRQGPGTDEATLRAYRSLQNLPPHPRMLDIGCGTGTQTRALRAHTPAIITAADISPFFLNTLVEESSAMDSGAPLSPVAADMASLPFASESFDILWSEGAVYIMGFENGLRAWNSLLKPQGYVVVSELAWIQENPPQEIVEYWKEAYPGMHSSHQNDEIANSCGYTVQEMFTLPEAGWWDDYYTPLLDRLATLRQKYATTAEILDLLLEQQKEVEYYQRFSQYYGYVFYILRKQ